MADSISNASDAEFLAMAFQFHSAIVGDPTNFGLTPAQATAFLAQHGVFSDALDYHNQAKANAQSARASKDAEREALEQLIRSYRNIAKAHGTSEMLMTSLGIPSGGGPALENATVPVATVDTSVRLRHTIEFKDVGGNGKKSRPRDAIGCEIWLKLEGEAPTDETQCAFLTLDTATPYLAEYNGADGGKMAHYMLRWAMRDGSKGGWGDTVSATITG